MLTIEQLHAILATGNLRAAERAVACATAMHGFVACELLWVELEDLSDVRDASLGRIMFAEQETAVEVSQRLV